MAECGEKIVIVAGVVVVFGVMTGDLASKYDGALC